MNPVTVCIIKHILDLAMQEEGVDRNSFIENYRIKSTQTPPECLPSCQITFTPAPESLQDHRLSEGKENMLETFKQSIYETNSIDGSSGEQRLSSIMGSCFEKPADNHCFEIKEESYQSEALSAKKVESQQEKEVPQQNSQKVDRLSKEIPLISLSSLDSQRASIKSNINQAIGILCKGIEVKKCCFNRCKIQDNILCFSQSFDYMSLFLIEKKMGIVYSMDNFKAISLGAKTSNFKRYLSQEFKIAQQLCFSIVFTDRTFDFIVKTPQIRQEMLRAIHLLMEAHESY